MILFHLCYTHTHTHTPHIYKEKCTDIMKRNCSISCIKNYSSLDKSLQVIHRVRDGEVNYGRTEKQGTLFIHKRVLFSSIQYLLVSVYVASAIIIRQEINMIIFKILKLNKEYDVRGHGSIESIIFKVEDAYIIEFKLQQKFPQNFNEWSSILSQFIDQE